MPTQLSLPVTQGRAPARDYLSFSAITTYMTCPLKFYFLCG